MSNREVGGISRIAALIFMGALLGSCTAKVDERSVEFRVPVSVEEVGVSTLEQKIVTTGTLRPPELVTLSAFDTGVLEINRNGSGRRFAEGDVVKTGDAIARIVGEDVRVAAGTAAAQRNYEASQVAFKANRDLFQRGLINQAVLDNAESAFAQAQLQLERARRTEQRNIMITPIDGVILALARNGNGQPMPSGQLLDAGKVVAQIAPLDPLIADVDMVGEDIAAVQVGLEARARYHAFGKRTFQGKVIRLAPTVDQRTRALRAEVEIDNREHLLRPGMFVEITLIAERRENVPVVPRRALTERGGRRVVFVLRGQRVVQQPVQLGLGDDELVEIREGVAPGDRLVVGGLEMLTDQMLVRVTGS